MTRTIISRLSILSVSLVITLILLEVVARLIPLWPDQFSDFDPDLGFAHIPGSKGWWVNIYVPFEIRSYVKINSLGLHDREIDLEKPEGTRRILLLGDSLVDALEVPLEDTHAKQLERNFTKDGYEIEVINGGHYGYGTDQELLFYRVRGIRMQPDIVVLAFMPGNDIQNNLSTITLGPKPYFEIGPENELQLKNFPVPPPVSQESNNIITSIKKYIYDHSKLYRFSGGQIKLYLPTVHEFLQKVGIMSSSKAVKAERILLSEASKQPGPYQAGTDPYLENGWELTKRIVLQFRQEVEDSGAKFFVVIMPDPRQYSVYSTEKGWDVTKWNNRLTNLCHEAGLRCMDLYPVFRKQVTDNPNKILFFPKDGHLTPDGHALIAKELYNYLSIYIP